MPAPKDPQRVAQSVQTLGGKLLELAHASWQNLTTHSSVTQEVAKDPFTSDAKAQAAMAELLIFLLHACDRVATALFHSTLPAEVVGVMRNAFMGGLVGVTLPAFVRQACPEEGAEELQETQADLLHLYNARATQYSFFSLGGTNAAEPDGLLTLAGIRVAEALDCPDNIEAISHGIEVIMSSLVTLREQLPLKAAMGEMMAQTRG